MLRTDTKEQIKDPKETEIDPKTNKPILEGGWSFANLQSWSCVPGSTCSIAVGPFKHVLQTELGEDICSLLKAYALTIVARKF